MATAMKRIPRLKPTIAATVVTVAGVLAGAGTVTDAPTVADTIAITPAHPRSYLQAVARLLMPIPPTLRRIQVNTALGSLSLIVYVDSLGCLRDQ
ncbi:hypothetical protein PC9H_005097 [Pleurotus ostreatus]|uniref:Uncharacterized protein n=1 Tax=Pleurotus ostreatus TaxID=5322 RepID=A0A8H7DWP9_PLEOS|nr:uncharacterized protein PC9H_005097 [Pleurotus ostreatus]KAF7433148.1 hypothetical protein PC9H_005097 [Pleurotus ostreatus]